MKMLSTLAILIAFAAPAAYAEDFDFAFSTLSSSDRVGSQYTDPGFTPGTLTGEFIGLSANGISSPTDVKLFSNPDHIPDGDLYAQGWFNPFTLGNTLTVTNGVVTGYNFTLYSATTNQELILGVPFRGGAFNFLIDHTHDLETGNFDGLSEIVFTPVGVPEPAGIMPFLCGVVLLLGQRFYVAKNNIIKKAIGLQA